MLLSNKNAVIYGAAGAIGSAVSKAFAREGAKVFLTGRTLSSLETVAVDICSIGGSIAVAKVDAMNKASVEAHAKEMMEKWGSIDISFNVTSYDDIHGQPLVEMSEEDFALPIQTAMATQFLTTTTAARQMIKQGSGVILALTAQAGCKPYPNVGGWGTTCAAIEGLFRQLACELGSHGIRVICMSRPVHLMRRASTKCLMNMRRRQACLAMHLKRVLQKKLF